MELIDDALGGFNVDNCNACLEDNLSAFNNATNEAPPRNDGSDVTDGRKTTKKYAFDVVDDESSDDQVDSLHIKENLENGNVSYDESVHKRIVRVSLQKSTLRANQGACFRGNESYALYETQKFTKPADGYQNNINIRFKTESLNGLMFLISERIPNHYENYFSLSVEDGWVGAFWLLCQLRHFGVNETWKTEISLASKNVMQPEAHLTQPDDAPFETFLILF